ncbi:hypothetical protein BY996DRAFT_7904240, partial [Phakopsora pachyrhizi]
QKKTNRVARHARCSPWPSNYTCWAMGLWSVVWHGEMKIGEKENYAHPSIIFHLQVTLNTCFLSSIANLVGIMVLNRAQGRGAVKFKAL